VVVTQSTSDQNSAATGISVTGQGTISVQPDVANIQFGVQTTNANAGKARTDNDAAMTKVKAAVNTLGVADADIQTTNYSIYPQYNADGQTVTGFTVNNTVSIKVKDLKKLGDIISAAVSAGANNSYGISFDVSDRTGAYNQALAQAMDKAKARANLMAKELDVSLGRVMTVSESSGSTGVVYPMADKGMVASGASSTPVSAGQMDITASVSVVYEIVK
jgi:uncharacterized protein YggE